MLTLRVVSRNPSKHSKRRYGLVLYHRVIHTMHDPESSSQIVQNFLILDSLGHAVCRDFFQGSAKHTPDATGSDKPSTTAINLHPDMS